MHGICEALLIFRIVCAIWIEGAPVISALNFSRDLRAVGIAMMQEQFPRSQPARIKV